LLQPAGVVHSRLCIVSRRAGPRFISLCAPFFVRQVDDVLISHMTTMRSLYDIYSTANDNNAAINSSRLMSVCCGNYDCCAHDLKIVTEPASALTHWQVGEWERLIQDLKLGLNENPKDDLITLKEMRCV
jgi:hypothetical protein